jgi:hypothetical protein
MLLPEAPSMLVIVTDATAVCVPDVAMTMPVVTAWPLRRGWRHNGEHCDHDKNNQDFPHFPFPSITKFRERQSEMLS